MTKQEVQAVKNMIKSLFAALFGCIYIFITLYLTAAVNPWFILLIVGPISFLILAVTYQLELREIEEDEKYNKWINRDE